MARLKAKCIYSGNTRMSCQNHINVGKPFGARLTKTTVKLESNSRSTESVNLIFYLILEPRFVGFYFLGISNSSRPSCPVPHLLTNLDL